ncbi:MAG: carboxypeptidase M32 [Brevundimonas sp.]|jgi:carboxypeptidase Taq|uniref:carboxypeptidase M32 n=1 Tax=Brevundimonas sp. TaxID=1871086 RepID=UPI0022C3B533|nr:carboxypeptidase M32 [Brevundimonas sp.]
MSSRPAYDALATHHARIYNLEHLQAMASWDSMTFMAPSAAPARGAAQAELNSIIHRLQNDPSIDDLIAQAQAEPLDESQAANLEAMRRQQRIARAIPDQLASQRELLVAAASEAWHGARKANDWDNFATALKPLVALVRQEADHLGQALGLSRYDALLERWEPGLRVARVADLFGDVSLWLPELVNQTIERQRSWAFIEPQGPFDAGQQKQVCERVMAALGFDFSAGRLDTSAHPFSGGVPEDVRLTTRFSEANALPSLLATVHETGHALYQQNLPREWLGQPLAGPHSAALHEGQALTYERQLAPTPAFVAVLARELSASFGPQPAFVPNNIAQLIRRVRRGKIRVEADELTYPAHVILRVEIEQKLIAGEIEVDDIPAIWDARMAALLQLDTKGDFANGPLQDIHWSRGMFGYFPAYLLGAMVAAQLFEHFTAESNDFEARAQAGDFASLGDWLREKVWHQGGRYTLEDLVVRATGCPLSAESLRAHLTRRYLYEEPGHGRH